MISPLEAIAIARADEQVAGVRSMREVERDPGAIVEMRSGVRRKRFTVPCSLCGLHPARSGGLCYHCNKPVPAVASQDPAAKAMCPCGCGREVAPHVKQGRAPKYATPQCRFRRTARGPP